MAWRAGLSGKFRELTLSFNSDLPKSEGLKYAPAP
jgi:hypothetical protein